MFSPPSPYRDNISSPPLLLSMACSPRGLSNALEESRRRAHPWLRHSRDAPGTVRLGAGLTAGSPRGSQVHVHRGGGAEEKESVCWELPGRLHPGGPPPPGSHFLLGGRRVGRGRRRPRRAGPRAAPMRFGARPRLRPVQALRSAAEEGAGRGGGGAARAKGKPSLPSWRPAGPWWPAPAAAARRRGLSGAASWPCCSRSPRRSGCRRRSWVSGARPAGGGLGLEGQRAGGSRSCSLCLESRSLRPMAARVKNKLLHSDRSPPNSFLRPQTLRASQLSLSPLSVGFQTSCLCGPREK